MSDVVYIVKGVVTDPDSYPDAKVGDTEYQFSDGPPGHRSVSADYVDLEEGLRDHTGKNFIWVDEEE